MSASHPDSNYIEPLLMNLANLLPLLSTSPRLIPLRNLTSIQLNFIHLRGSTLLDIIELNKAIRNHVSTNLIKSAQSVQKGPFLLNAIPGNISAVLDDALVDGFIDIDLYYKLGGKMYSEKRPLGFNVSSDDDSAFGDFGTSPENALFERISLPKPPEGISPGGKELTSVMSEINLDRETLFAFKQGPDNAPPKDEYQFAEYLFTREMVSVTRCNFLAGLLNSGYSLSSEQLARESGLLSRKHFNMLFPYKPEPPQVNLLPSMERRRRADQYYGEFPPEFLQAPLPPQQSL